MRDLNHDAINDFVSLSPLVCCSPVMLKLWLRHHTAFEASLWSFGMNSEEIRACRPDFEPHESDKGRNASSSSLLFLTYVYLHKRSQHAMYTMFYRIKVCGLDFSLQQVASQYGACPKNETCAFSEALTHHCTGAGGVGYEKILD